MNEFVAEVGKAYERATENREEADAMAKKVHAGVRYVSACVTAAWERVRAPAAPAIPELHCQNPIRRNSLIFCFLSQRSFSPFVASGGSRELAKPHMSERENRSIG